MSLNTIPANGVAALDARRPAELRKAARRAGQAVLEVDLGGTHGKDEVLAAIGKAFGFPAHYGGNLDALYDCATDLVPPPSGDAHPGFVVMLRNLPDSPEFNAIERAALLDVFRQVAQWFEKRQTQFRVLYSVRSASPRQGGHDS